MCSFFNLVKTQRTILFQRENLQSTQFIPGFNEICIAQSLVFCVVFCRIIVCPSRFDLLFLITPKNICVILIKKCIKIEPFVNIKGNNSYKNALKRIVLEVRNM
jgi:hypothetical protein